RRRPGPLAPGADRRPGRRPRVRRLGAAHGAPVRGVAFPPRPARRRAAGGETHRPALPARPVGRRHPRLAAAGAGGAAGAGPRAGGRGLALAAGAVLAGYALVALWDVNLAPPLEFPLADGVFALFALALTVVAAWVAWALRRSERRGARRRTTFLLLWLGLEL